MLSLPLTIVCLAAVLPIHLTSCEDPLIWGFVEAQVEYKDEPDGASGVNCSIMPNTFEMRADGSCLATSEFGLIGNLDDDCDIHVHLSTEFNIKPDGAPGADCSSVPNTFEMRADGSWVPTTEIDLTGDFDDDCGIHVQLSIPEVGVATEDPLKVIEDLKTVRERINNEWKDLQVKEAALANEKKAHEEKMEELREEIISKEDLEDDLSTLKKHKNDLSKRQGDIDDRRSLLRKNKEELDEINVVVNLSDYNCTKITYVDYGYINIIETNFPVGSDTYVCEPKDSNIGDTKEKVMKTGNRKIVKEKA